MFLKFILFLVLCVFGSSCLFFDSTPTGENNNEVVNNGQTSNSNNTTTNPPITLPPSNNGTTMNNATTSNTTAASCGDGEVQGAEDCAGSTFLSPTDDDCKSYDAATGTVSCDESCKFNFSACLPTYSQVSAYDENVCALKTDGVIVCFGTAVTPMGSQTAISRE